MAIGFGAVGGAGSHRVLGLFLRTDSTIARADLGGPRGHVSLFNPTIPIPPTFGGFIRRCELPFRPHLHAHIPWMTFVSTGIFALASFMLALIVLKKFRSFQKPSRIARTFG